MRERYRKILSIDEKYYQKESPLLLEKAALLFDEQKEINIFQGKFTNVQSLPIAAVYVDITCYDISGKELGVIQGIYLDMNIRQNASFGTDIPVEIPYADARKFSFAITKIAYTNGTIKDQTISIHSIPKVERLVIDSPVMEQYIREISLFNSIIKCRNMLVQDEEYWICPCGTLNATEEKTCRKCGLNIDKLTKLSDTAYLNQRHMEYEEELRRKEEIERQQEEDRRRNIHNRNIKRVKLFLVCALILTGVFLLAKYVVLPRYYSDQAQRYLNEKNFDTAEKTFQKITGSLRASIELEGYYDCCIKFLNENDIDSAQTCYEKIQDTEEAKGTKINDLWKNACIKEANNGNQDHMLLCYSNIKNQDIIESKELNDALLQCGKKSLINLDFESAKELYLSKVVDKYSASLENVYYDSAKYLIEEGNYIEAVDHCFEHISSEHISELSGELKKAYLLSIDKKYTCVNNFSEIQKYLSKADVSSIKKVLYTKGKKNLRDNEYSAFSDFCFAQLKNYKDSSMYRKFLGIIKSGDIQGVYKKLQKLNTGIAKRYLRENIDIKEYKESLKKITGSWKGNGSGYDYYVTISESKVTYKRYYDDKPVWGIVDPRAGELRDSDSYKLKYSSYSGWYYTRFGRDLKIIPTGNGLKFQFYDVWKRTIKMHK